MTCRSLAMLGRFATSLLGVAFMTAPASAQSTVAAQGDTIVLIVTSPRGHEVTFSGTVVLRETKTTRRFDKVSTPFELRLARQDMDARFTADDGGALSGEIVPFRDGKKVGHVSGTMYSGAVQLHLEPGGTFGFGGRGRRAEAIP